MEILHAISSMKRQHKYGLKKSFTTQMQLTASPITWEALDKSSARGKESKFPYEVTDGANFYELEISIPNRRRDDFNILIKGRMLHIRVRPLTSTEQTSDFLSILNRPIILPGNLDPDFISAEYQNGTLRIYFFKSISPCKSQVEKIFVY